jgi:hypothetical protein
MEDASHEPEVQPVPLCAACGEVIGVYEPLVHVINGVARKTSRAAEPQLARGQADAVYHLACRDLGGADLVALN